MCWEIRQRYLPAEARGRFFLKGERDWAGVAWRPWRPWSWDPSCSWQGFGTGVLSRGAFPACHLWGLKVSQPGCTCSSPDLHPLCPLAVT